MKENKPIIHKISYRSGFLPSPFYLQLIHFLDFSEIARVLTVKSEPDYSFI